MFPGCLDTELTIKTVNQIKGNKHQNYTYDSEGCIRTQRPVGLTSLSPREFAYASFLLTGTQSASAIEMLNDCRNCCDCEYFARTYQGIKRQWFLYQNVAAAAEQTRDTYADNIARWNAQKAIRESDTLRLLVSVDGNCKVSWGLAHCNASKCCISGITVELTWLYYVNGILQSPTQAGYDCGKTKIDGSAQCNGPESIVMDVDATGRVAYARWDYSDPQTITTLQGRHCFPDCINLEDESLKVRLHAVVLWPTSGLNPDTGESCAYPGIVLGDYDTDVLATWAALGLPVPLNVHAQKLSPLIDVRSASPYCERCSCTEGDGSIG